MKWELSSADHFLQHKEYIDTAIIPLVRVSLADDYKESVQLATWVTGVAHALEEQLTGRVLLLPVHTYYERYDEEELIKHLSSVQFYLQGHQFKYIVFLLLADEQIERALKERLSFISIPYPEESEGTLHVSKALMEKVSIHLANELINLWQK